MGYEEKLIKPALKLRLFLDKTPNFTNVVIICMISCISGLMFGVDISSMSAFISTTHYLKYFNTPGSVLQGFITASMSLGSFFGSIASSFISEPLGRRASLLCCAFFWCVGAAIQSSSQNVPQLIIGRFISGVGVGFGSSVAPIYGSELAPRKVRGFIGGLFQFSVTLGILIMFYVCYGLQHINGTASFRIAWGLQIIPGLCLLTGCFFIPESPRWLAKNGYWDEAEEIVALVQAKGNHEDPDVQIEISEIKEQLLLDEHVRSFTYFDLFRKKYLTRTLTAIFAQIWQQLTGMNTLMYYIVYIFEMAGYTGNTNLVASSIQYVLNCATTVPALYFMDKLGRRPILIFGGLAMLTWQFAIGGILATYSKPIENYNGSDTVKIQIPKENKTAARAVIACCYLFVCSFAVSWGVGIWLYVSEVWGDNVSRARGSAAATSANWALNFAIAMFTPSAFRNITYNTYFVFGAFCAIMTIHVYFGFPETKGKRLEEIAQIWDDRVPAWRSKNWQPRVPLLSDQQMKEKLSVQHNEGGGLTVQSNDSTEASEKEHVDHVQDPENRA